YGEVLLNKAEALAELGRMTPGDWAETIGALRERAGISGPTLTTLPTVADPYLVDYYRGQFTDPVLLEVVRERAVELVFEGLRPDDLIRWHLGELFEDAPMNGMYVPGLGEYDLNGDGVMDVLFYQGTRPTPSNPAIAFVYVSPSTAPGRIQLSNGTSGEVIWNPDARESGDKKYLLHSPKAEGTTRRAISQNPAWLNISAVYQV